MFQEIALRYDMNWRMLAAQAYIESGFDSLALGKVDLYADMDTTYLPLQQAQPLLVSNAFSRLVR